jgi:hypothetical protein
MRLTIQKHMQPNCTDHLGSYHVAHSGLNQIISSARSQFISERQELQERNRPKVAVLEMTIDYILKKHSALLEQIEPLLSQGHVASIAHMSLVGSVCFWAVGYALSRTTIAPFHLGWTGEVFSVGLSILLPYAIHGIIQRFALQRRVRSILEIVLFLTAVATMVAFAGIRADVFRREITAGPAVIIDTLTAALPVPDDGTETVANLLQYAWISAAIGFELACGLCWHDFAASTRGNNFNLIRKLEKELHRVEVNYLAAITELQKLLSEPAQTYARNWADFRRGLSDAMVRLDGAIRKSGRAAALLLASLFLAHSVMAADSVQVIAEVDLSATEKSTGFGTKSEFDQNLAAVSQLLASLPAGARVSVIGITDQTFSSPLVLISATLAGDEGYFGSRLARGRRDLVSEWSRRSRDLKATAPHTDVIGGFMYASEIFLRSSASRKLLVIFSDLRNDQPGVLDLERPEVINVARTINDVEKRGLIPMLSGVEVAAFGSGDHAGKKGPEYLISLRSFWAEYIKRSGGRLKMFSTSRDMEALVEAITTGINAGIHR